MYLIGEIWQKKIISMKEKKKKQDKYKSQKHG